MSKCLVTGGCGFIGSHIVDRLISLGHTIDVIDDLSAPQNSAFYYNHSPGVEYHKNDISTDDCASIFKDVDYVFHLAARSRIQPTISNPSECFEVNVLGTQRVLEWSRLSGVKNLVYSSTSSLYGHQNSTPFTPNMPTDCLNPYSMSKWMGEQICKLYFQLYDFSSTTLRYFNVYGPREPVRGEYAPVVGLFKRQVARYESVTVVGDGNQKRDFTYIDDVVNANILAIDIETPAYNIYNIGSGKSYSILELANMISRNGDIVHIPERPAEVRETLADIESTKLGLGWSPEYFIEDMINSY